jgi:hypothetical protein
MGVVAGEVGSHPELTLLALWSSWIGGEVREKAALQDRVVSALEVVWAQACLSLEIRFLVVVVKVAEVVELTRLMTAVAMVLWEHQVEVVVTWHLMG